MSQNVTQLNPDSPSYADRIALFQYQFSEDRVRQRQDFFKAFLCEGSIRDALALAQAEARQIQQFRGEKAWELGRSYHNIGVALYYSGDQLSAKENFRTALSIDGKNNFSLNILAGSSLCFLAACHEQNSHLLDFELRERCSSFENTALQELPVSLLSLPQQVYYKDVLLLLHSHASSSEEKRLATDKLIKLKNDPQFVVGKHLWTLSMNLTSDFCDASFS